MRVAAAVGSSRPGRRWVEGGHLNIVRPADGVGRNGRGALERIVLPAGFAPLIDSGARLERVAGLAAANTEPKAASVPAPAPSATPAKVVPSAEALAKASVAAAEDTGKAGTQGPVAQAKPGPAAAPPAVKHERVAVIEARDLSDEQTSATHPGNGAMLWIWLGGLGALAIAAGAVAVARLPADQRLEIGARLMRTCARLALASIELTQAAAQRLQSVAIRTSRWVSDQVFSLKGRVVAFRAGQVIPRSDEMEPAPFVEAATSVEPAQSGAVGDPALASVAWTAAALLDEIEQAVAGLAPSTPLRSVLEEELRSINERLVEARAGALSGEAPERSVAQFRAMVGELERVKRIASGAAASIATHRPVAAMPLTKAEAYQLLGVNADVNEGILKKLVDALRMTWHPDHARDELDRQVREDRIKQINIAWDLITDKRATA
jgi:hypothetical protein